MLAIDQNPRSGDANSLVGELPAFLHISHITSQSALVKTTVVIVKL